MPPTTFLLLPCRMYEYGPGCFVGTLGFMLLRPVPGTAVVASVSCRLLHLRRTAYERMTSEAPATLSLLQYLIMRSTCLDLTSELEVMERNMAG